MQAQDSHQPFRPWLSIWFHPRETVSSALQQLTLQHRTIIFGLFTLVLMLDDYGSDWSLHSDNVALQILEIVLAAGLTYLFVAEGLPRLFAWTGGLFRVYASVSDVRTTVAITLIPSAFFILLSLFIDLLVPDGRGEGMAAAGSGSWLALGGAIAIAIPAMLLGFGLLIWIISISCRGLSELFHYSSWMALLHSAIVWTIFILLITLIAVPVATLTGFFDSGMG